MAGGAAGIGATSAGGGNVHVTNSGSIDPTIGNVSYGIYAAGNGTSPGNASVVVTNSGAISDAHVGIHASTLGANSTVTVNDNLGGSIVTRAAAGLATASKPRWSVARR